MVGLDPNLRTAERHTLCRAEIESRLGCGSLVPYPEELRVLTWFEEGEYGAGWVDGYQLGVGATRDEALREFERVLVDGARYYAEHPTMELPRYNSGGVYELLWNSLEGDTRERAHELEAWLSLCGVKYDGPLPYADKTDGIGFVLPGYFEQIARLCDGTTIARGYVRGVTPGIKRREIPHTFVGVCEALDWLAALRR